MLDLAGIGLVARLLDGLGAIGDCHYVERRAEWAAGATMAVAAECFDMLLGRHVRGICERRPAFRFLGMTCLVLG